MISLTKEPRYYGRYRHIMRKYHYLRHRVEDGDLMVNRVSSEDNQANPFTKALSKAKHIEHDRSIRLMDDISFSS